MTTHQSGDLPAQQQSLTGGVSGEYICAASAPRAERPMVDRPTAVNQPASRENKGLRGLGALVGAPGLTGGKKKVQIPRPAQTTQAEGNAADKPAAVAKRASALEKGIGAGRTPVRGKPRHLGLILVAILLLVLAVIAAYSTTLAFRSGGTDATEFAAADSTVPAPEDEMLADGVMLDEMAADETAALPEAEQALPDSAQPASEAVSDEVAAADQSDLPAPQTPEPAETALASAAAPVAVSAADNIVLAAKDPVPTVPSPLDPPDVVSGKDAAVGTDDRRTAELWTFERTLGASDPNWVLARTEPAAA